MTPLFAVVIGSFTLTAGTMLAQRRHATLTCHELIRKLHPHQLSGMDRYLEDDSAPVDDQVWESTGQVVGLYKRWRNRIVLLRLCQLRACGNTISSAEMDHMRSTIASLSRATLRAAALSAIRPFARTRCDLATLAAFRLYAEVADTTHALLALGGVPLCAGKLASIL